MQPPRPIGMRPAPGAAATDRIASVLVQAYRNRGLIEAPSRTLSPLTKAEAQEIAERVRDLRIAGGDRPAGYKVGFTNAAVRAQFGAEAQIAAPIYRETLVTGRRIAAGDHLGPRIEPEVVLGLGPDGEAAWAAFGFEIVQSHVADWKFGYLDTIVDFGLHAALIVGDRQPMTMRDIEQLAQMRVRLLRNGVVVEHGASRDVDGGPLGSLAWLRTDVRRVGRDLVPGEIVATGSMTRVPAIAAGERWTIEAVDAELAPLTLDVD